MDAYQIIKRPVITEKGTLLKEKGNFYIFEVEKSSTKGQIKEAIETMFKVKVDKVNTVTLPGKARRAGRSMAEAKGFKKAIVKLKAGDKIEIFEGV